MAKKENKDLLAKIFPQSNERIREIVYKTIYKKMVDPNCNLEHEIRRNGTIIFKSCRRSELDEYANLFAKKLREFEKKNSKI